MSKKDKRHPAPNFSPAALLRPRLDALWRDEMLLSKDAAAIQDDLDVLRRGIKPDEFVRVLLRAYLGASPAARAHLDTVLPEWLRQRELIPALKKLVVQPSLDRDVHQQAIAWLAREPDVSSLIQTPADLFYQAYHLDDRYQALVNVLWYTDTRRRRVHGVGFLIDYNPPWDGAVKDVMFFPKLDVRDAQRRYIDSWGEGGQPLTPIPGAAAKTKILGALECNRRSKIRLPRDLLTQREAFTRFVLALPDAADTPPFTEADWEVLVHQPETPEKIRQIERTVGRRVRMDDGHVLWILGAGDDDF